MALLLSGCSLLVALTGLVRTFVAGAKEETLRLLDHLAKLEERAALLEMKMGMFWRLVEEHLSGMLKKPTHAEMDALLDKLKAHTLTLAEAKRLRWWLERVYLANEIDAAQHRITAILVLAAVESVIHELERSTASSS